MRYLHPKLLCLVVPALVVIAYLVLVGVNYLFVSILMEFFPLSALILIPFDIGFAGGLIVPVLAMLWALVCFFLRFDGKRPVLFAVLLIIISFISASLFGESIAKLSNLPLTPPPHKSIKRPNHALQQTAPHVTAPASTPA
jgi:hypothetical protein